MLFSIILGFACGGMVVSILGLINPLWVGAEDREIIYESLKGWFAILFIMFLFYDADNFNVTVWLVSSFVIIVVEIIFIVKRG